MSEEFSTSASFSAEVIYGNRDTMGEIPVTYEKNLHNSESQRHADLLKRKIAKAQKERDKLLCLLDEMVADCLKALPYLTDNQRLRQRFQDSAHLSPEDLVRLVDLVLSLSGERTFRQSEHLEALKNQAEVAMENIRLMAIHHECLAKKLQAVKKDVTMREERQEDLQESLTVIEDCEQIVEGLAEIRKNIDETDLIPGTENLKQKSQGLRESLRVQMMRLNDAQSKLQSLEAEKCHTVTSVLQAIKNDPQLADMYNLCCSQKPNHVDIVNLMTEIIRLRTDEWRRLDEEAQDIAKEKAKISLQIEQKEGDLQAVDGRIQIAQENEELKAVLQSTLETEADVDKQIEEAKVAQTEFVQDLKMSEVKMELIKSQAKMIQDAETQTKADVKQIESQRKLAEEDKKLLTMFKKLEDENEIEIEEIRRQIVALDQLTHDDSEEFDRLNEAIGAEKLRVATFEAVVTVGKLRMETYLQQVEELSKQLASLNKEDEGVMELQKELELVRVTCQKELPPTSGSPERHLVDIFATVNNCLNEFEGQDPLVIAAKKQLETFAMKINTE